MGRILVLRDLQGNKLGEVNVPKKVKKKEQVVDKGTHYRIFKIKDLVLQRGADFVYQAVAIPV